MSHEFGNIKTWTKEKLDTVRKYLDAYMTALKNKNFDLSYIDAFAGTGFVSKSFEIEPRTLFDVVETTSIKEIIDGSTRIALQTNPVFNEYIFIEKSKARCKELESLKEDFLYLASSIKIVNADANEYVLKLCQKDWIGSRSRAVMFLDPYGMQVNWETIEAIAKTKAIDLWLLFPIGSVNRLLNRNGHIKEGRRHRLNKFFGDESWFDAFFEKQVTSSFLGEEEVLRFIKTASFEKIGAYLTSKLKSTFADAAANPLFLTNSNNSAIFLLTFAVGNPNGAPIAIKIAQHILGRR